MNQTNRIHIGLRTLKTAIAVIVAMVIVYGYGVSTSKLIFAMLGAMSAITPTFRDSLESCLTQIVGVLFGAIMSVVLLSFSWHPLVTTGVGIVSVITLYNAFGIRFSPSLPCMIVVMMCTTSNIQPFAYAFERIWDSTIGLGVGLLINTLVFPYDNSHLVYSTLNIFDEELILILGKMFVVSDEELDTHSLKELCHEIDKLLELYSRQVLVYKYKEQKTLLESFTTSQEITWKIYAYIEVMRHLKTVGSLTNDNHTHLLEMGVDLSEYQELNVDSIVNIHLENVLKLRQELLESMKIV